MAHTRMHVFKLTLTWLLAVATSAAVGSEDNPAYTLSDFVLLIMITPTRWPRVTRNLAGITLSSILMPPAWLGEEVRSLPSYLVCVRARSGCSSSNHQGAPQLEKKKTYLACVWSQGFTRRSKLLYLSYPKRGSWICTISC